MSQYQLIATCAFGLESVVKRELKNLGIDAKGLQPGWVGFTGDESTIALTNLNLRSADRVLIEVAHFEAKDFDQLFETTKYLRWADFVPVDGKFPVKGRSIKSQLSSVPACQRSVKRAIAESLQSSHGTNTLPESGALYQIEIALRDDLARLTIDTTGPSLHKRGYRTLVGEAPLKETLAAALVLLSVWKPSRPLIDPFCGSGTIPIEAAMIAKKIPPGLYRKFSAESWQDFPGKIWSDYRKQFREVVEENRNSEIEPIIGNDIDPEAISLARYHANRVGLKSEIHFQQAAFEDLRSKKEYGCVITNPPYGERLKESDLTKFYKSLPQTLQRLPTWSHFILTGMPRFEAVIQQSATRRRKLYNGRIECMYYQYLGPRPDKRLSDKNDKHDVASEDTSSLPATNDEHNGQSSELQSDHSQLDHSQSRETPLNYTHVIHAAALPASLQNIHSEQPAANEVESNGDSQMGSPQLTPSETTSSETTSSELTSSELTAPTPEKEKEKEKPISIFGGVTDKTSEQAELFVSRLTKRARHLRRWPKKGITCYRLYERDIPELPFVVDIYEDNLHIVEFERPHDRSIGQHAAWQELMCKTAAKTLNIDIANVHFKAKNRQRKKTQHEKLGEVKSEIIVNEGGLQFIVNLSDYVDTGLFLDHRIARDKVRSEAKGKRVLNLFGYTGAFSVYAADGGAMSIAHIDLSNTYVDWAKKNMSINRFHGPSFVFESGDAMEYLEKLPEQPIFDLAVIDPPTFSNSKKTDEVWEVQKQHVKLLTEASKRMSPDGVIYFSTNYRTFKLDTENLPPFKNIRNISNQTVPEDFRNKRIHQCWRIEM